MLEPSTFATSLVIELLRFDSEYESLLKNQLIHRHVDLPVIYGRSQAKDPAGQEAGSTRSDRQNRAGADGKRVQ